MEVIAKSWTWQKEGEPADLVLKDKRTRTLRDNDVLIQNTVIGINPVDWKLIEWGYPDWEPNTTPGVDGAGIILAVGKNMTHLRIGSRVCYHTDLSKDGSFSTHTVVSGFALMSIPDKVNNEAAATFSCPCLTAWQAFQKVPDLAGRKVLISSAGGAVGYFLTQLLLQANAKVFIVASTKHHSDFLQMGVSGVADYKGINWQKSILNYLHVGLFDVLYDTVNGSHASELASMLSYYGHLVAIQDRLDSNPIKAFTTISIHEVALGAIHKYGSYKQITELKRDGESLLHSIGNGTLKLREYSISDFNNLPAHLAEMKQNHSSTKYLIRVL